MVFRLLQEAKVGREFQHIEDLVYIEGYSGVVKAVTRLLQIAKNSQELEVKWDGSPAIIFGRDSSGQFHFGDKFAKDILSTPQQVYDYYTRSSRTPARQQFAKQMSKLTPYYEQITPKNFSGYLEAGLLWSTRLQAQDGQYVFEPNTVRYSVDATSDLGKRIGGSVSGAAATAYFDELPALGSARRPVGEHVKPFLNSRRVIIIPPKFAEGRVRLDSSELKSIVAYAKQHKRELESFIASESGLSDIRNIIYRYVNSQIDSPTLLADLGDNFSDWITTSGVVSRPKQERILARLKQNPSGASALFELVRAIMIIKDDIIDTLEQSTLASMGITAELGKYGSGGEGFVHDPIGGEGPAKLVSRGRFSAANRGKNNPELTESTENMVYDIAKLFPNYEVLDIKPIDDRKVQIIKNKLKPNKKHTDSILNAIEKNDGILKLTKQYYVKQPKQIVAEEQSNSDTAVVGWGRGMGHKGHMYLADSVIEYAKIIGADPYMFVSETVGRDDPLTPEEKLAIYKKVFPEDKEIFKTGKTPIQVANLINELGYKNLVFVVGKDQVDSFQFLSRPTKSTGLLPVPFDTVKVISRQQTGTRTSKLEGPRATPMRQVLLDPDKQESEQFLVWRDAMPDALSDKEVHSIMLKVKDRLGGSKKLKEADNPYYFGGSSLSPIPGTPDDLSDTRTKIEKIKDMIAAHHQAQELAKWMGHK